MKTKLRITFNAPLVLCFALACAVVTLIRVLGGESVANLLFSTYGAPMSDPLMYLRLFTHVLGHADLGHLVGNMAYILLLGPGLEEKYGTRLLGASGVAFAFILLTSFTEFRKGEIPLTVILVALIYLGQQIWEAVAVRDNISNLSHIIGGLVGGGAGYLLNRNNSASARKYHGYSA